MPKRMIELKKKGYKFPELEARGYLIGWEEKMEVDETDWTFQQMDQYESKRKTDLKKQKPVDSARNERMQQYHDKMQNKFDEIYENRQNSGLN